MQADYEEDVQTKYEEIINKLTEIEDVYIKEKPFESKMRNLETSIDPLLELSKKIWDKHQVLLKILEA